MNNMIRDYFSEVEKVRKIGMPEIALSISEEVYKNCKITAESAESAEIMKKERPNMITESIIGAAIEVHRALDSGIQESAYEACLTFELVVNDFPDPLRSLLAQR